MSIDTLTNAAVARRTDFYPQSGVPQGLAGIARAGASMPVSLTGSGGSASAPEPQPTSTSDAINTGMHVLFGYIPTEVLTLYVAVVAAIAKPAAGVSSTEWTTFWIFLGCTPVVVWLVNGMKVKAAQKPLPLAFRTWPIWEMIAASIAYCAWAFALPRTPFAEFSWYSSALSGIAVLVASTVLGLLAPFFQLPIKITP